MSGRIGVCDDRAVSLATYLAALDGPALISVLQRRGEVLVEPVPRDVAELADRLGGVHSLSAAMGRMDADEVAVARTLALTGLASVVETAEIMPAEPDEVAPVVERLAGRARAGRDGELIGLPERLATHLAGEVCYLRSDDRDFAVRGIEAVGPAG